MRPPINDFRHCGSEQGYKWHKHYKEAVCQPCRDAHNEWRRDYHKRNPHKNSQHKKTYQSKPEVQLQLREYAKDYASKKANTPEALAAKAERKAQKEWEKANPSPEKLARQEAARLRALESQKKYRLKNKAAISESGKRYRLENAEKIKERAALRRAKDIETHRAKQKAYYEANKERIREVQRLWRSNNPSKRREAERRSRARHYGVPYEYYTEQQVLDKYGFVCYICNVEIDMEAPRQAGLENWEQGFHLEHYIPLHLGGSDILENARPSHAVCNLVKGKLHPDVFFKYDTPENTEKATL